MTSPCTPDTDRSDCDSDGGQEPAGDGRQRCVFEFFSDRTALLVAFGCQKAWVLLASPCSELVRLWRACVRVRGMQFLFREVISRQGYKQQLLFPRTAPRSRSQGAASLRCFASPAAFGSLRPVSVAFPSSRASSWKLRLVEFHPCCPHQPAGVVRT